MLKFFKVALGRDCIFVEGYGQTEGMGTATRNIAEDLSESTSVRTATEVEYLQAAFGSVGVPLPCSEYKLLDVPDMGYLVSGTDYLRRK